MSSAEGGSDPACPELVNLVVAYYPKDYSEALKLQWSSPVSELWAGDMMILWNNSASHSHHVQPFILEKKKEKERKGIVKDVLSPSAEPGK